MKNNWLHSAWFDIVFICMPPFVVTLCVLLFNSYFQQHEVVNHFWWILLILLMDVGHVYSTLYKTYFNKQAWRTQYKLLTIIPVLSFLIAFLLYQFGDLIFWRGIAYMAVFHFIRQQYGFVKVYNRKREQSFAQWIEIFCVYTATLYPILYWHTHGPFAFNWFTRNDFLYFQLNILHAISFAVYVLSLLIFAAHTIYSLAKGMFNPGSFLIIAGTYLSWYIGIVAYNNDLIFTITNVASHGLPYYAIIWVAGKKQTQSNNNFKGYTRLFRSYGVFVFIAIPVVFAFVEEGLWDGFIWKENERIFSVFHSIRQINIGAFKQVIVPILISPQLIHYLLDGFIWKVSKGDIPELAPSSN